MQKKFIAFLVIVSIGFVLTIPFKTHAMQQLVLGTSDTANIAMSPTTDGPGLFLPSSPFFFLDQLKQFVRLSFALTPEQKAQVHMHIAGERLAELRIELQKNDLDAIGVDVNGIQTNLLQAGEQMKVAQLSERNIETLSENLNTSVKEKQAVLRSLEAQATGLLHEQIAVALETSKVAKNMIENGLRSDLRENEIADDVKTDVQDSLANTSITSSQLAADLQSLAQEATGPAAAKMTKEQLAQAQSVVTQITTLAQTLQATSSSQKSVAGVHTTK